MNRRGYLDWLRGVAVLIMIEGHTLDSWTLVGDRQAVWYERAIILAGFGAPLFLFLAGITLMLAAGSRIRKGLTIEQAARAALRRGAWVFLLAFLFRLQAFVLGGAQNPKSLLKVDILNIMGLSMLAAAVALMFTRTFKARALVFSVTTLAVAMATPLIRETPLLTGVPDPIEAYFRPIQGLTTFTLFPWAGFLAAGCLVGACLDREGRLDTSDGDARLNRWLVAIGATVALAGYLTSLLPPIYPSASFWTSSPTFFFMRLGILVLSIPAAFALSRIWRGAALQEFGRASLFVYWVHVEMVYGVLSAPIHRRLPFSVALAGFAAFTVAMFGLVRLKDALVARYPSASRGFRPSASRGFRL